MCPKCKSRERVSPYSILKIILKGYPNTVEYAIAQVAIALDITSEEVLNATKSFFCCNCGYEIGRWG